MIILHTLGDTLITIGDRKIRPSSPLVFASLLYLATERGRRVPRTALQELLFPEAGERSGAHSLRQLLYKLRQLGAPLEADATSVYLSADHVRDDAATTGASHSAVVSFLPDFEPDISERYNEWLEQKRAEFAASIRKRLVASIEANRESLNWQAVERDAQLLLSVDPFNEVGTFALAEAAALQGGKAAALRILSEYERETGRTDLRLPASLLRRRISQAVPDTPVPTLSALPFVGRDAEVKELRRYIARARAGQPCLYVIGGEAGIGKTRLLTEVSGLAALEGMSVFTVRCQAHYSTRPLSLFIELVPALLNARGALGISPQSLGPLGALTSHSDETTDRSPDSRDDLTRSELLLAAIRDLVDAVASEQPLVFAIEDAHWADRDSIRELSRLAHGGTGRALVAVCTTRTPEAFPVDPSAHDQTQIRRLKPLAGKAMSTLAAKLLTHRADGSLPELIDWTLRTAGGNPLFLQMLCSHYTATGDAFAVPPDVLSAVTRRVQDLRESERQVLAVCALLGKHATIARLHGITRWSDLKLFDSVQPLEDQGYLVLLQDAIHIAHDLVGQSTLALLPPLSKRILHGCVAAALENEYDRTNDASLLWDCAAQWEQSGNTAKAIEFLTRCARHAIKIGRAYEALQLLEQADRSTRCATDQIVVLREQILAARAARQWERTTELARRLLKIAPVLEHSAYEFAILQALWNAEFVGNGSIHQLQRCIHASDASTAHRIDAGHLLLCIAHETGNSLLASQTFDEIKGLLSPSMGTATNRTAAAIYEISFGDARRGHEILRGTVEQHWHFDSITDELRAALNVSSLLTMVGDLRRAIELASRYYATCGELGLALWQTDFATHICTMYCIMEDFELAQQWAKIAQSLPIPQDSACSLRHLANQAEICVTRGDRVAASQLLCSLSEVRSLGDSLRGRAYFAGLQVRNLQLDPSFQVDDQTLENLKSLYERVKTLMCADSVALAYAEALLRRGLIAELEAMLNDYLTSARRELGPLCPSIRRFIDRLDKDTDRPSSFRRMTSAVTAPVA